VAQGIGDAGPSPAVIQPASAASDSHSVNRSTNTHINTGVWAPTRPTG